MAEGTKPEERYGLPAVIPILKMGDVPVELEPLVDEQIGFFDPKNKRIVISTRVPDTIKHTVLLHEVMKIARNMLDTDDIEVFLNAGPLILLHILTGAGLYSGMPAEEVTDYLQNNADEAAKAAAAAILLEIDQ